MQVKVVKEYFYFSKMSLALNITEYLTINDSLMGFLLIKIIKMLQFHYKAHITQS